MDFIDITNSMTRAIENYHDFAVIKAFVMDSARLLKENGITLSYTCTPIDTTMESFEDGSIKCNVTQYLTFDHIDTDEHDKKVRDQVIDMCLKKIDEIISASDPQSMLYHDVLKHHINRLKKN